MKRDGIDLVEEALGECECRGAGGGKPAGDTPNLPVEIGIGHDPRDQARDASLIGGEHPTGQHQIEGNLLARQAAEDGHHHGRDKAALDFGVTDLGSRPGDDDIAGGSKTRSASQGLALHDRDDRLGNLSDPLEQPAQFKRVRLIGRRLAIGRGEKLVETPRACTSVDSFTVRPFG